MAFILKENNNNNKGILVLKHLELKYYSSLDPNLIDSLRKKIYNWCLFLVSTLRYMRILKI